MIFYYSEGATAGAVALDDDKKKPFEGLDEETQICMEVSVFKMVSSETPHYDVL